LALHFLKLRAFHFSLRQQAFCCFLLRQQIPCPTRTGAAVASCSLKPYAHLFTTTHALRAPPEAYTPCPQVLRLKHPFRFCAAGDRSSRHVLGFTHALVLAASVARRMHLLFVAKPPTQNWQRSTRNVRRPARDTKLRSTVAPTTRDLSACRYTHSALSVLLSKHHARPSSCIIHIQYAAQTTRLPPRLR
jgi:hypothetical protein